MENQPTTNASVDSKPIVQPALQSKTNWLIPILFTILVSAATFGSMGYYLGKQTATSQSAILQQLTSSAPIPKVLTPISEITSDLKTYTNTNLAFSLNLPTHMFPFYGGCQYNEAEQSYRPKTAYVPVKTFEDGNSVYISHEYYYQLGGERIITQGVGTVSYYSTCDKVTNRLDLVKDANNFHEEKWKITVEAVRNNNELTDFIKKEYGSGCNLEKQQLSKQIGIYDISIKGDGKDLGETKCPINYMIALKYSPEKQKVATWILGQACTFFTEDQGCLDSKIAESFRFN